jgi:hypothetical protein
MNEQQYIEHEVQIRVLKEMSDAKFLETNAKFTAMQKNSDDKFFALQKNSDDRFSLFQKNLDDRFSGFEKRVDERFSHVEYKVNLLIGLAIGSLIIPLIKIAMGMI